MKKLWLLAQLVFAPAAFQKAAAAADLEARLFGSAENAEEMARDRVAKIRAKQTIALLHTVVLVGGGYTLALLINEYLWLSTTHVLWARLIGVTILAWATLARLGWELQSMAGTTLAEQVHAFAFRFFYGIGVFVTVAALFLRGH